MTINGKIMTNIKRCSHCGAKLWMNGYDTKGRIAYLIKQKSLCYDCAYWIDLYEYPPEFLEIINGECFRIHPFVERKDKTIILGGGGKTKFFMRSDYSVLKSNDIWKIGKVPDRFRDRFPDTVSEINKKTYNNLKRNNRKCNAKGCLDRYQCFRYNLNQEKDKPFNKVPSNWKIGGEHCGFFIPKDSIN